MQLFRHTLAINFTKLFKISLSASLIIFLLSIAMIFVKGLGESIDFKGGTTFNITFSQPIDIAKIRVDLRDELNQNGELLFSSRQSSISAIRGMPVFNVKTKKLEDF